VRSGRQAGDARAPLVSVILPVYSREGSVGRAIRSVLAQTYGPLELVVIDDGSTDGTRGVVEGFGAQVTFVTQAHAGAYAARNAGLRRARGELVAFIDSDDAWLPDKLAAQVPLMRRPEVGLVFGDAVHVSEPREDAPRTGLTSFGVSPPRRGRVADRFAWCNFVPTCTALVRRRCLEEAGGFSEASAVSADYLAWFRIALRHELDYVERVVAEYTVHAGGISFALGRSVAARIDLFSAELARTTDPPARAVLRRLLFNLSLHLALAALRGRSREVASPLRLAWRTASGAAGLEAAPWSAAFAAEQLRVRTRRFFS
jgi:glycosyltransferase involved in cell wall biosynthesis